MTRKPTKPNYRERLTFAAKTLMCERGFAATSVDEICRRAQVAKGLLYYHFASKDSLTIAALEHWSNVQNAAFLTADNSNQSDPWARLVGFIQYQKTLLSFAPTEFASLTESLLMEIYLTHPKIRNACLANISAQIETITNIILQINAARPTATGCSVDGLAAHIYATIQGAFTLAKANQDLAPARESLDHLLNYINLRFGRPTTLP